MDDAGVYGLDDVDEHPLPFGAVVAVSNLVACLDIDTVWPDRFRALHRHEHANGPWCWILEDVRTRLKTPIRFPGARGVWPVPVDLQRRVRGAA